MKNNIHEILFEMESIKSILEEMDRSKNTSSIEYDLAMDKMRKVYGMMSEVNKFKETIDIESVSELVEIKILAKLSEVIDTIIERKIKSLNVHEKPNEKSVKREDNPKSETLIEEKKTITEEKKMFHEALAEKTKAGKSVYDRLSNDVTSSDAHIKTIGRAIPDLEKAISLNEKFVFIKELFGGNAQKYSQAVTKLNTLSGIAEAMSYISSNFPEWDMNNNNAKAFIDLVKRRFL